MNFCECPQEECPQEIGGMKVIPGSESKEDIWRLLTLSHMRREETGRIRWALRL